MATRALMIALIIGMFPLHRPAAYEPPQREVVVDNDSVQLNLISYPPGTGDGRHTSPVPELGIVQEGEVMLETPKGRESVKAGRVYWIPGMTPHDVRNETDRPAKVWSLLLKRA